MSKKKTSKRLENLFSDLAAEEIKPAGRRSKPAVGPAGPLTVAPPRPQTGPGARSGLPRPEGPIAPVVPPAVPGEPSAMSLAFRTDEKNWATLRVVDEKEARNWAMEDQMLVKQVADQLSLALENARLFQETQQRAEELAAINRIISSASQILELHKLLEDVLAQTLAITGFTSGLVSLYDEKEQRLELIAHHNLPLPISENLRKNGFRKSLCELVFLSKESLNIPDLRQGAPVPVEGLIANNLFSYLGMPLKLRDQVIGTLCVFSDGPRAVEPRLLELVNSIGVQLGFAIENARLFDETQRRAREMSALAEVGEDVSASLDLRVVLERIAAHAKELLNGLTSAVYLPESDGVSFKAIAVLGAESEEIKKDAIVLGQGILGQVAKTGRGEIVNDALQDRRALTILGTGQLPNEHLMAAPLLSGEHVSGLMAVWRIGAGLEFGQSELDLLTGLARQAAIAVENARLFETTRESQQAVARSEGELRALFTAMTDVIIILDKEGRYLRIAPTNPSRLVKPPDELLGQLTDDVLPSEAAHSIKAAIQEALGTGQTVNLEYKLEIDQQEYWFGATVSKLNEEQVFLVARDITDRKYNELLQAAVTQIAEAALSAEDLASLLKVIHRDVNTLMPARNFYISLYDERTDLITFPYHAEEDDLRLPSNKPGQGLIRYVLRTGQPLLVTPEVFAELERSGEVKGEERRGLDWLGVPLRSGAQRIGVMAVQTFDPKFRLTAKDLETLNLIAFQAAIAIERKRAEETLRRRNEYLAAAAEIGRLVTSTLDLNTIFSRTVNLVGERFGYYHAAIFVVEETGFNAVLVEATGEGGEEMKRKGHTQPVNSYSIIGRAIQIGAPVVVNNTAMDGTHKLNPFLPYTRAEAAIPLRVGTRVIGVLDIQSPTIDAFREDDMGVLQILTDQVAIAIDNARSYELSQQAVKDMREVDHMKSMFLANMSHELRTPLNSIIGFSRVILKGIDGPVSELQQQDLTAIYNSGQHLLGLINDILDLSKIEAGKMELAFDEVNMIDVINGVMSTVVGLIKDKPVKLVKNIQENLPTVRADAIRVRQVLLNLLSNAAKFTSEGSITVEAAVAASPAGHPELLVRVTDTGPGIEPKDQAKLFQPFSQVDDSLTRKTGGSGLGLSISQQLVQMHGGRIGLESVPGKGSTFYFTLPIYRASEETPESRSGKVILAIDDDPQVISLYERYLQPQGYQVVALTNPSQSMERAKQLKPYAITLDIMMPGYDGWSVLSDLKSDVETRDIPVIICSIVEEQERGFSLGAAGYLLKPILEDELLNALDHLNSDGSIREVLVIDDNPSDLRLMDKILKEHGRYKARLAEGGRRGWEAILSETPHAVILDLFMPEMDGFTILEKMRENPKLRDIPVVVVSGVDLSVEQQQQLKDFGQRLLSKGSLNESDLLSTIERALRRVEGKK